MNVGRRSILKGAAVGGLSVAALSASGLSMATALRGSSAEPALALVSGHAAEAAFLVGARSATSNLKVQRTDLDLSYMQQLEQQLNSPAPQRIIGLVDDASAALIIGLARSAGARVQWIGQHSADAKGSQHQLVSADEANCALRMGHELRSCGAGFALREQKQGQSQANLNLALGAKRTDTADQWAATLGHVLASANQFSAAQAPRIGNQKSPLRGHFVSFSIETGRSHV